MTWLVFGAEFRWSFYGVLTYYTNILHLFVQVGEVTILGSDAALGQVFSRASGSDLNIIKCELEAIKGRSSTCISNVQVKNEVRYSGVIITKDQQRCLNLDVDSPSGSGQN